MNRHASFRQATVWSFVMTGGQQATMFVVTVILAALLGPRSYGTVAMATVYVMFLQMLLQQGLIPAIVQRRDLRDTHLDSAFWCTIVIGGLLTVVSMSLSGWWAAVNRLPELQAVIVWLSLLLPIRALVVVQQALLTRAMDFRSLAVRSNVAAVGSGVVGIGLALAGAGVRALVAQQVARAFIELVVLWTASDWRPSFRFSLNAARQLWSFSVSSSAGSLAVFANNRADALLIGLFFGPVAVGLYRFALRFIDLLIEVASRSLQAVALPELSRLQDEPRAFAERTVSILHTSALLAFPALGVLAATSESLMAMLGQEWAAAATVLELLCLVGAVRAASSLLGPMLQATGRPQLLARLAWLQAVLSAGAFVAAGLVLRGSNVQLQVLGMAGSRVLLYIAMFVCVHLPLLVHFCRLPLGRLLRSLAPAGAAAVAAVLAGRLIHAGLAPLPLMTVAEFVTVAAFATTAAVGTLVVTDGLSRRLVRQFWYQVTARRHVSPAPDGRVPISIARRDVP